MKRINFYLADSQIKRLKPLSVETGLSVSEIVRRMIDSGLEKLQEKKEKEQ